MEAFRDTCSLFMPSEGLGIFLRERDTCLWLEAVDSGIDRDVLDQAMDGLLLPLD